MHPWIYAAVPACLLALTGCASLTPPTTQSLSHTPVVRFGEHAPENQPFILWYPAGADIPIHTSASGSLLAKTDASTLNVKLKQDIYVYQQWASFDGKTWQRGNRIIDTQVHFALPGTNDGNSPGTLSTEFNLK